MVPEMTNSSKCILRRVTERLTVTDPMEEAATAASLLDKIKPPRLEDAGLEDCALPPESIKEAFLKAASAVRSLVSDDRCVDDPWEDSSDALVGIKEVNAPSEGCVVEKGGGPMEGPRDAVVSVGDSGAEGKPDAVVVPGPPGTGPGCVDTGAKDTGSFGKEVEDDVAEDDDEEEEGQKVKPTLVEDYYV
ncbi:uncharacterized protein LOC127254187 [Andrographis paniculata]|uniref:uncharacterized protein LOC127254187 n=1 Tax=Andrographis paniculata TaxID=175694 RepID=UPI0021E74B91|nr:uncharacterized protein LOC127254187 [Andrographis paniculata]